MTRNRDLNNLLPSRRSLLSGAGAVALAGIGAQLVAARPAKAADPAPMFMFIHTADMMTADPGLGSLRLINVSQQTLYFSDRPERIAGHMTLAAYLEEWIKGKDNFGDDPPNATLSVYEKDTVENTLAAIEIFNPMVDGADLVYGYKVLDGTVPTKGGATALFIDMIGIGGGVGVGYHGVGVGLRGPGVL